MDVRWRIEMLGGLRAAGTHEVGRGDRVLTRFRTQKTGALLAYLAYYPQRSHLRDALIELFWPDGDPSAGRNNLSRELAWLRQHLEPPSVPPGSLIAADRATIRLNPEAVATDVAAFEAALQSAERAASPTDRTQHLTEAIEAYGGELLPGYYDAWVLQEREWLADRYFQALGQLLALLEQTGEIPRALEYARRGVRTDPLREEAQRDLIRLLAAAGQAGAALRQYRELERLLRQELDAKPAVATRALSQQLVALAEAEQGAPETHRSPQAPAPAAAVISPHRLPMPRTPLLGREREVAAAQDLLRRPEVSLLTLTGVGGSGKTRLALQVASELRDDFPDGVFFVDLAPIRDPDPVASAIAQALGVRESAGCPTVESLKENLREKQILLLLDNQEHLIEAAPLEAELLTWAPRLKLLVTSRTVLRLHCEQEFPVPPLALPDLTRPPSLLDLSRYAAVALFVQRARAVRPEFELTNENAPAVAEICVRVDGLPLAIELAAARVRLLPPQALLARLEDRLRLLTGGARDLPTRQQSLRNTIAWSYDLLGDGEKRLFRRLSVFVGGCRLADAEVVCSADGDLELDVLDGMTSLVEKSLLREEERGGYAVGGATSPRGGPAPAEGHGSEPRFGMLETIREYGLEALATSGEAAAIHRRHAAQFLALAEETELKLEGPDRGARFDRLEQEHGNLRAALSWAVETGEAQVALRLTGALWEFWFTRAYLAEGRQHLAAVLALPGAAARTATRAKALDAMGHLACYGGDLEQARFLLEESLAIAREVDEKPVVASAGHLLGEMALRQGHHEAAQTLLEESLAVATLLGQWRAIASALHTLGEAHLHQGDLEAAARLYEESLALFREHEGKAGIAWSLQALGNLAQRRGDHRTERALFEEALAIRREMDHRGLIIMSLNDVGRVALSQGDYRTARECFTECLERSRASEEMWGIVQGLERVAMVAEAQGDVKRAARLLGAVERLRHATDASLAPPEKAAPECLLAAVRAALGEAAFAAAWAAGREMSLDDAIVFALEGSSSSLGEGE